MARRKGTPEMNTVRKAAQAKLKKEAKALEVLNKFYQDVPTQWDNPESCVLGHIILSPPISVSVSSNGYTEDWAVIEIDPLKIGKSNPCGNATDLSICIPLKGTILDKEMRHPTALDQCLMVIKQGNTTGLTIGCANNIFSYIQNYENNNAKSSKE
ncbi:hypothetical protein FRC06_003901 [Ceratobasidium sp. 370]|nr:hypothetical protein FRC06_003901 [Ceratobasidium sp. 370]